MKMAFLKNIFRTKMKPRDIRAKYGLIVSTNLTPLELQQGVERQWRRFNCKKYQDFEFQTNLNRIYPRSKSPIQVTAECECDYCSGRQKSLLGDFTS